MPLPKPKPKEKQGEFMVRCVSDSKMKSEFPNKTQRIAVCYMQWKNK